VSVYNYDHTTSEEIWSVLVSRMKRGTWYKLSELYDLVESHLTLVPGDFDSDAPGSAAPRWQRNVRNVLQRRKANGYLDWRPPWKYRLVM